jgi:hypothetical protein
MINKTNIDVQIYLDSLMEGINQMGILSLLAEEFEINPEELRESLIENFSIQASVNFESNGDPVINEDQFEEILNRSAVECTVESMVKDGILIKSLEDGKTENSYSIHPEVKKILDEEDGEE